MKVQGSIDIAAPPDRKDKEQVGVLPIETSGGAGGIRTRYLLTASQALSQLSYSPKCVSKSSIKPHQIQEA